MMLQETGVKHLPILSTYIERYKGNSMENKMPSEADISLKLPKIYILPFTREGKVILTEKIIKDKKIYNFPKGVQINTHNLQQTAYHIMEEETGYYPMDCSVIGTISNGTRSTVRFQFDDCIKIYKKCIHKKDRNIVLVDKEDVKSYLKANNKPNRYDLGERKILSLG